MARHNMHKPVQEKVFTEGWRHSTLVEYRRQALRAAQDFHYPNYVLEAIRVAGSCDQISNIMTRARKSDVRQYY